MDGSDLKLTNCSLKQNGTDRVQRIKEGMPGPEALSAKEEFQHEHHAMITDA